MAASGVILIRYATTILFGNNLWLELFYFTLKSDSHV